MALPPSAPPSLAFTFSRTFTSSDERTKMRPASLAVCISPAFKLLNYATKNFIFF